MPDLAHRAVEQQHLDDVETKLGLRVAEPPQVLLRRLAKQSALALIHRSGGARPAALCPRLHLDEHQAVTVPKHEVDLAALRAEIGGEKLEARPLEMPPRRRLADPAPAQMLRLAPQAKRPFNRVPQAHRSAGSGTAQAAAAA